MTRVKLNLLSGSVQEREVVTAFNLNGIKYIIFDGESTGSMGLPIILVSKENLGKVVGITDAEEWKNTKECLKKIISGESVDYISVDAELKADDIYYRQLTLPIASFDILKSSYNSPADASTPVSEKVPVFEPITPEDIVGNTVQNAEPVAPSTFSSPMPEVTKISNDVPDFSSAPVDSTPIISEPTSVVNEPVKEDNYEALKDEFLKGAEELFDKIYKKLNHED